MRRLLIVLLLIGMAAGTTSTEILRPSSDSDPGTPSWATLNCGVGSHGPSGSGALAYDAAGQATSVTYTAAGISSISILRSRLFSGIPKSANTYSAVTLNINSSSPGMNGAGAACIVYSIDGGTSYSKLRCDDGNGWGQTTDTVALSTSQDLTKIRVGACTWGEQLNGDTGTQGTDSVLLYDIWTSGTYTPANSGPNGNSKGQAHRGAIIIF